MFKTLRRLSTYNVPDLRSSIKLLIEAFGEENYKIIDDCRAIYHTKVDNVSPSTYRRVLTALFETQFNASLS